MNAMGKKSVYFAKSLLTLLKNKSARKELLCGPGFRSFFMFCVFGRGNIRSSVRNTALKQKSPVLVLGDGSLKEPL